MTQIKDLAAALAHEHRTNYDEVLRVVTRYAGQIGEVRSVGYWTPDAELDESVAADIQDRYRGAFDGWVEEVGVDGCGCPITEVVRPNGSNVEGTERTDHRSGCWNQPQGVDTRLAG